MTMEQTAELSEGDAADQLEVLFNTVDKNWKGAAETKQPEKIQTAVNTNIMILSIGITHIFNRIKSVTPRLLGILNTGLTNFWTGVINLLKTLPTGTIQDWKVGTEMNISLTPSMKFSFTVTYKP